MKPGATRCPECRAPRIDETWTDPQTKQEHVAVVRHRAGCSIYRSCDFDRREPVAHLQDLYAPPLSADEEAIA